VKEERERGGGYFKDSYIEVKGHRHLKGQSQKILNSIFSLNISP
jgi:hypothetical protein